MKLINFLISVKSFFFFAYNRDHREYMCVIGSQKLQLNIKFVIKNHNLMKK